MFDSQKIIDNKYAGNEFDICRIIIVRTQINTKLLEFWEIEGRNYILKLIIRPEIVKERIDLDIAYERRSIYCQFR